MLHNRKNTFFIYKCKIILFDSNILIDKLIRYIPWIIIKSAREVGEMSLSVCFCSIPSFAGSVKQFVRGYRSGGIVKKTFLCINALIISSFRPSLCTFWNRD